MAGCMSIWDMIVQNVRMRTCTVLLPMCPTDGPMARGELEGTVHPWHVAGTRSGSLGQVS